MSPADTNGAAGGPSQAGALGVLPPGYRVAEFRIERVIGQGGFGIVYLAFDTRLERLVALKEFMPPSLAQRLAGGSVVPLSERHRATFELGLRSFIKEARSLAQFKHPALVEVYRFWEELGTAYMVMPFYEGQTLKQRLDGMAAPPQERWLRELMERVLLGLDVVHRQGWLHRDIAPDNILLLPGDRPVLLDFGSARQDIGDATQALAALLKPGYAPFEQYSDSGALKQGPWTDLYALGALLYFAIGGRVPAPSVERVKGDAMVSALVIGRRRYSAAFLQFIDHCLAVWPEQRPRNIAAALELLRALDAQEALQGLKDSKAQRREAGRAGHSRHHARGFGLASAGWRAFPWVGGLAALLVAWGGWALWKPGSRPAVPAADQVAALSVLARPSAAPLPPPPGDEAAGTPAAARPDQEAAPPLPVPLTPAPPAPAEPPPAPPASPAPLVPPAPFVRPATPEKALDDLLDARDPGLQVVALPVSDHPRNRFRFTVKASEPGFLYVFAAGPQRGRLELLWPSGDAPFARVEKAQAWSVDVTAPLASGRPGQRRIGVMVSKTARHLAAGAGWQRQAGVWGLSFSGAPQAGAIPWFGQPDCAAAAGTCNEGFGAVRLDVAYSREPVRKAANSSASWSRSRQVAARNSECESLTHLLSLDGNILAQRRFSQLGCRHRY